MRAPVIAYGRTEPDSNLKIVGRRHQVASIKKVGGFSKIDIEFDVASGSTSIKNRPALSHQIHKAHEYGVPLAVEAADRVLSTYNKKNIRQLKATLDKFGVQFAAAHTNPRFHRRIQKILAGSKSPSKKQRALVQWIDGFLRWRHGTIFSGTGSAQQTILLPYRELKNTPIFPVLEQCATKLLELEVGLPDFDWCLHGFLGAAFNDRNELLQNSRQPSAEGNPISYGMRPQDADLFCALHELEQIPLTTVDGRSKHLSNQRIADDINRLGFRNLRGTQFSRKTVFQIRRSPAFLGSALAETATAPTE